MAAPVRTNVCDGLEPMRNAMVDLLRVVFLWATSAVVQAQVLDPAHSRVRLRDTFRDNLFIALLMAEQMALFRTLHLVSVPK